MWVSDGKTLIEFRSARAYVLLGEPGAGKSTAFKEEKKHDANAVEITARRFIRGNADDRPEWRNRTVFIDGLDEVRAGGGDPREPLDCLVRRLDQLGKPRFRLSCREDAWLGRNDLDELSAIAESEEVHLLRLNPLGIEDAHRILTAAGVPDSRRFYWKARERGLRAFLENPLLLDILAWANKSGSWPEGRLATFERACETLARETNREHLDGRDGEPFAVEEVVLAAGRLCSMLLLCGKSGWSRRGPGDEEYPPVSEAGKRQALMKYALATKLFEGDAETGRRPRHRQIAEFLAAWYLDHVIRERGLPASRVLAWMRGMDGIVVPDLRGVSLWLSARNTEFRRPVIESDPVGVVFHGDAERFTREETALLIRGLEAQLKHQRLRQYGELGSPVSVGALMAGQGREILYSMLRAGDRSEVRRDLVEHLLRGLGEAISRDAGSERARKESRTVLVAIVRDPSWGSSVRCRALIELMRVPEDRPEDPSMLLGLLRDLSAGVLEEDESGSLGLRLLEHLYPQHVGAKEFWVYVEQLWTVPPPSVRLWNWDKSRWAGRIVGGSTPGNVRILVETLVANAERLNKVLAKIEAEEFAEILLTRGLELLGEETDTAELYEWFEVVKAAEDRRGLVLTHCDEVAGRLGDSGSIEDHWIYGWLRSHREIQLQLVLEGLRRNASSPRNGDLDHAIGAKFLGDEAPPGFRRWCLKKAIELAKSDCDCAIELALWTVTERTSWGPPLDEKDFLMAAQEMPLLLKWHGERVAEGPWYRESEQLRTARERREAYIAAVRQELPAIEGGQGPVERFDKLGRVYLKGFNEGNLSRAREDLADHLDNDAGLQKSVINGFRKFLKRTDLPTLEAIVGLEERRQSSPFGAPLLAGLIEKEAAGKVRLEDEDEDTLRRALAFYLISRMHTRSPPVPTSFRQPEHVDLRRPKQPRPKWFLHALKSRSQSVAEVFLAVNRARVRARMRPDQHMYDLPWEPEYRGVGPLAVPGMFTPFPSRCTRVQVNSLRAVLWAALNHMAPEELRQVIRRRLCRSGMDIAQRAAWLAAGLFVDRERCVAEVVDFLSAGKETRGRYFVDFLVPYLDPLPDQDWPTPDLIVLIKAIGKKCSPLDARDFAPERKAERLMDIWMGTLADRLDEEAVAGLAGLAKDPALDDWRGSLVGARGWQGKTRRVSVYMAPTIKDVRRSLNGGAPLSVADLAALVFDKLTNLVSRIRDGNTDQWQQYWHTDPRDPKGRKVIKPKAEDACRDALLSDLQIALEPLSVDAQPEGHHAEDARSDILAVRGAHAVVVEVKKTDSENLWSAITDQLITKYARDPRSGGYGILLVFWFGVGHLKKSSPSGAQPGSPEKLRCMLEGLLSDEQRRTVRVIVVDVSAPAGRVNFETNKSS